MCLFRFQTINATHCRGFPVMFVFLGLDEFGISKGCCAALKQSLSQAHLAH